MNAMQGGAKIFLKNIAARASPPVGGGVDTGGHFFSHRNFLAQPKGVFEFPIVVDEGDEVDKD